MHHVQVTHPLIMHLMCSFYGDGDATQMYLTCTSSSCTYAAHMRLCFIFICKSHAAHMHMHTHMHIMHMHMHMHMRLHVRLLVRLHLRLHLRPHIHTKQLVSFARPPGRKLAPSLPCTSYVKVCQTISACVPVRFVPSRLVAAPLSFCLIFRRWLLIKQSNVTYPAICVL